MARMAPIMAAPPAMSYFIFSMLSAGLMEIPPVSKVMPFPTRPNTGPAGALGGSYFMTMSAGGSSEPCATLRKAPICSSRIFSVLWTWHCSPTSRLMAAARSPRIVGVRRLPGSLTSSRAKFWDSPTITPSRRPVSAAAWSMDSGATT